MSLVEYPKHTFGSVVKHLLFFLKNSGPFHGQVQTRRKHYTYDSLYYAQKQIYSSNDGNLYFALSVNVFFGTVLNLHASAMY